MDRARESDLPYIASKEQGPMTAVLAGVSRRILNPEEEMGASGKEKPSFSHRPFITRRQTRSSILVGMCHVYIYTGRKASIKSQAFRL